MNHRQPLNSKTSHDLAPSKRKAEEKHLVDLHYKSAKKTLLLKDKIYRSKRCISKGYALYPCGCGTAIYMCSIGMCCCEGYCFQAVYSRIGYINQRVWV